MLIGWNWESLALIIWEFRMFKLGHFLFQPPQFFFLVTTLGAIHIYKDANIPSEHSDSDLALMDGVVRLTGHLMQEGAPFGLKYPRMQGSQLPSFVN